MSDLDRNGRAALDTLQLDEADLAERMAFLEFSRDDDAVFREVCGKLREAYPDFATSFYEHLKAFPTIARLIEDPAILARLERTQAAYFDRLMQGDPDVAYARDRARVGIMHHKVDLPPRWYLSAFQRHVNWALPRIWDLCGGEQKQTLSALRAFLRLVTLDIGITLDAHLAAETTARKQAEQHARRLESLRLFKALFEHAPDAILALDDEGRCVDANAAACSLLGRSREEISGRRVGDCWPQDGAADAQEMWDRLMTEDAVSQEVRLRRADGVQLTVEVRGRLRVFRGTHLLILRDITAERQEAEVLSEIAAGVSADSGQGFLQTLVESLSRVLSADLVFVGEISEDDPDTVLMLAGARCGEPTELSDFSLVDSPCCGAAALLEEPSASFGNSDTNFHKIFH